MQDHQEMEAILYGIESDENVQQMKRYKQHGSVSTYEHCKNVARMSYRINRYLALHSDLEVFLTGAMLHD